MKSAEERINEILWINTIRREQVLKILKEAKEELKKGIEEKRKMDDWLGADDIVDVINVIIGKFEKETEK